MSKILFLKMPALSPTMQTGKLTKWIKQEGDNIAIGEVFAEIDTDKATMEAESSVEGVLYKIIVPDNTDEVLVDAAIGVIGPQGLTSQQIEQFIQENVTSKTNVAIDAKLDRVGGYSKPNNSALVQSNINAQNIQNSVNVEGCPAASMPIEKISVLHNPIAAANNQRILISPYAKSLAKTHNIDITRLIGTGKNGFIVAHDIERSLSDASQIVVSSESVSKQVKMSPMRKAISKKVCYSKQTIPHFYVSMDIDMQAVEQARQNLLASYQIKTTINDWFIIACARALVKVPQMNQVWEQVDEVLVQHDSVHINCAIDVGSGPLLVLLHNVHVKSLQQVHNEMKEIVNRAKEKTIKASDLEAGTFSISNLGMYGVSSFSAIINPPQVAVLAIGAAQNGVCTVTVSCDHRVLDGRDAAIFLKELKQLIEMPLLMLV